ncbi:PDZ domain-containing protein, partial [Acidobacteria bacterium AH-259-O06]|nr:PDZ domain-containing protein [Acidobacteria bacterium AH-259-O06]
IDFDGLAGRVARLPVPADNYSELRATNEHLFYIRQGALYLGRASDQPPALQIFSIKDRTVSALAEKTSARRQGFHAVRKAYALSQDGSKALVLHQAGFKLYDASPRGKDSARSVSTKGLMVDRVPAEEWVQIFDEAWRHYRELFYAENMHGYDWEALREQYRPLLAHVAHRADLNYVMGEMIGELNKSHGGVDGGDYEVPKRPQVALPGARFSLDSTSGRYQIAQIFRGHNEEERYRSPLTEIGIDVREGDYVLAIGGQELLPTIPIVCFVTRPTVRSSSRSTISPRR